MEQFAVRRARERADDAALRARIAELEAALRSAVGALDEIFNADGLLKEHVAVLIAARTVVALAQSE